MYFPSIWCTRWRLAMGSINTSMAAVQTQIGFRSRIDCALMPSTTATLQSCRAAHRRKVFPAHLQDQLIVLPEGLKLELYGPDPSAAITLDGHCFAAGSHWSRWCHDR
jgi:hypothetical protein